MALFKTAQRQQAKLRLAIDGPSGSGKTYSSLLIAKGLTGGDLTKVALIDTEHGSGSLYADLGPYAVAEMHAPFAVEKYVKAIEEAAAEGFEVVIIDSLTHAWSGEGGLLDQIDRIAKAKTSGNSFAAWKEGTPLQKKLFDAILGSKIHVIATIRTKTEWVIEENERGKKAPRKIGLAPEQRKDIDYEFTVVLDMSRDGHFASASKDRTGLFDKRLEVPSEAMGVELLAWLNSGVAPVPAPASTITPPDPSDPDTIVLPVTTLPPAHDPVRRAASEERQQPPARPTRMPENGADSVNETTCPTTAPDAENGDSCEEPPGMDADAFRESIGGPVVAKPATTQQKRMLGVVWRQLMDTGTTEAELRAMLPDGKASRAELTADEASGLIDHCQIVLEERKAWVA